MFSNQLGLPAIGAVVLARRITEALSRLM